MRFAVTAGILILTASINAQRGQPNNTSTNPTQAQAPAAPATIPINQSNPTPGQPQTASQNQQSDPLWPKFLERAVDPVTWFTGLLLLVSFFQLLAMRHQSQHMSEGLELTKVSNAISDRTAAAAAEALKITQRGPIGIISAEFERFNLEQPPTLALRIRNFGHAPVSLKEMTTNIWTGAPLPEQPKRDPWKQIGGVVPPEQVVGFRSYFEKAPFSKEDGDRFRAEAFTVHVYGAIRYNDGFGTIRELGFAFDVIPWNTGIAFQLTSNAEYNYST
jgi:hypothetical protein